MRGDGVVVCADVVAVKLHELKALRIIYAEQQKLYQTLVTQLDSDIAKLVEKQGGV